MSGAGNSGLGRLPEPASIAAATASVACTWATAAQTAAVACSSPLPRRLCASSPSCSARRKCSGPVMGPPVVHGPVPALIPRAHPANFACLPGLTFLRIRRRMGEVISQRAHLVGLRGPRRSSRVVWAFWGQAQGRVSAMGVLGGQDRTAHEPGRSFSMRDLGEDKVPDPRWRSCRQQHFNPLTGRLDLPRPGGMAEVRNATLPADYERLARVLCKRGAGARCHPVLGNGSHQSPRDSGNVLRAELPLNSLAAQCAAPWRITWREGGPVP